MSYNPSAPPLFGGQAPPGTYPSPTYPLQSSTEPPPPYQVYPPGPAAPLVSKELFGSQTPTQPPYQHPGAAYAPPQPGYSSAYPPPPAPQPGYQPQPQLGYGYQPPPQPGYQPGPPPQPGYGYQPPQAGYQPPQAGYQPPPQPPVSQPQGYDAQQISAQMTGLSLQQQPGESCGVLSDFAEGNVVILKSCASGKTLRILQDGSVNGQGGHGKFAHFKVHVRRPGVVALQNEHNPDHWLAIFQGTTIGTGTGDPYCDFIVKDIDGKFACLESVMTPGHCVGVLPTGQVKPATQTSTGQHGRFIVKVQKSAATSGGIETIFADGNVVILRSCASNRSLVINTGGVVQGVGGRGVTSQFKVHVRRPGVVALQSVHKPKHWLAIYQGTTIGTGKGGLYCDFQLKEVEGQYVCLESVMHPGEHVGVLPNGSVNPPTQTGEGSHGRFTASVHTRCKQQQQRKPQQKPQQMQQQMEQQMKQMQQQMEQQMKQSQQQMEQQMKQSQQEMQQQMQQHMQLSQQTMEQQSGNGPSSIMSMFSQGNVVILQSKGSGKSLRINNGDVDGLGARGTLAQFRVHVRSPGVVALQNVHEPCNWLAIFQEATIGTGKGGSFAEFKLTIADGSFVCLESVACPGQYVGVMPDGSVKLPNQTKTGPHGRFIPSLLL